MEPRSPLGGTALAIPAAAHDSHALFAAMAITDSDLFSHLLGCAVPPHSLHISQQLPKKRMAEKRGRIADQQQLAPCAGHAHVHAANVRQKAPEAGR